MGTDNKEQANAKLMQAAELLNEAAQLDPEIVLALTASGAGGARYLVVKGNDYVALGLIDELHGIVLNKLVAAYQKAQVQEAARIVRPKMVLPGGGKS